jgi:hypothetical protein
MLEGGLEFLKYDINIEKASMIYLSPVQKEHVKIFLMSVYGLRGYTSARSGIKFTLMVVEVTDKCSYKCLSSTIQPG